MPSLADNIFIFILALLLFGPKKLPMLARELGKWIGEFRRASSEFRMQMEDEIRVSDQADKQKQIDAMVAANPVPTPDIIPEPEHPHTPVYDQEEGTAGSGAFIPSLDALAGKESPVLTSTDEIVSAPSGETAKQPIAVSGDLSIMPPATGLPAPRKLLSPSFGGLLNSIPFVCPEDAAAKAAAEAASLTTKELVAKSAATEIPETASHG